MKKVIINEPHKELEENSIAKIILASKEYLISGDEKYKWNENDEAKFVVNNVEYDFGKVIKVAQTRWGMDYKIIQSPNKKGIMLMFAGTKITSIRDLWADINYIAINGITEQGSEAYNLMNNYEKWLDKSKSNKLYVVGHSLGGMNAQLALSEYAKTNSHVMNQVTADIFESPNIYRFFDDKRKASIDLFRDNITNYTKQNDLIGNAGNESDSQFDFDQVGKKVEIKPDWNVWDLLDVHNLGTEQKSRDGKIPIEHKLDFSKYESILIRSLNYFTKSKNNEMLVNMESIIITVKVLENIIEQTESNVNGLFNSYEMKHKHAMSQLKELYYKTAPNLDPSEVESRFNEKESYYANSILQENKDKLQLVKKWRKNIEEILSKLVSTVEQFDDFDKKSSTEIKNYGKFK